MGCFSAPADRCLRVWEIRRQTGNRIWDFSGAAILCIPKRLSLIHIYLISVLEQNGLQKQKEEVQALVGYIDGMEEKLSQMMDEMKEMRLEEMCIRDRA